MLAIWRRTVDILISLLVPPLSEKPYIPKNPLGPPEIDVIFKWLQLLKAFFNVSEGGVEHGVPLTQLQSGIYKDIIVLGQYLDLPTVALKERASAAVKAASRPGGLVGSMRGLSLEADNERMAEVLLRIARTRWVVVALVHLDERKLTRGTERIWESSWGRRLGCLPRRGWRDRLGCSDLASGRKGFRLGLWSQGAKERLFSSCIILSVSVLTDGATDDLLHGLIWLMLCPSDSFAWSDLGAYPEAAAFYHLEVLSRLSGFQNFLLLSMNLLASRLMTLRSDTLQLD